MCRKCVRIQYIAFLRLFGYPERGEKSNKKIDETIAVLRDEIQREIKEESLNNGKMEEKTLMNKIFTPHELKTIEVDTEKKIFRINGEDFGEGCTGFTISCTPGEFEIRAEIDTTVEFANYSSKGELQEQGMYKRN